MRSPVERRFWAQVKKGDVCWNWTGATTYGYGAIGVRGKHVRVHRFAYELLVGPIPEGLVIDHLCRNRKCVNPDHMEPVTHTENCRRGMGTKLTVKQVKAIRASSETTVALGAKYGVDHTVISAIRLRRRWADV